MDEKTPGAVGAAPGNPAPRDRAKPGGAATATARVRR